MNVKLDTKEKFTVITPEEAHLSVNMTDELNKLLLAYLQKDIPHVILKMDAVQTVDEPMAENIAQVQQQFYENNKNLFTNLPQFLKIAQKARGR